ncbi:hypothetical protein ACMAY6_03255 [Luminiphilus sp. nBUS_16]|uniref:hypothetical protein n=1 Tax=Luminiphilus sp. nBUS_16 TaxID=3395315 RepID=UPI003EBA0F89
MTGGASAVRGCLRACSLALVTMAVALPAASDTLAARCELYPQGESQASKTLPCQFSQRQGYVSITRSDGIAYHLSPQADAVGNYLDQDGQPVYRRSGLGSDGLIFQMPELSVYVYWDVAKKPDPEIR